MAQLDGNIFLQQQGVDFNKATEGFERGMRLGDMMRENKIKQAEMQKQADIKDAFNNAYDVKEDGSRVLNPTKVIDMVRAKGYGQDAYNIDQQFKTQQVANAEGQSKLRSSWVEKAHGLIDYAVKNPNTPEAASAYQTAYSLGKQSGVDLAGYSPTYSPQAAKMAYGGLNSLKETQNNAIQQEANRIRWAELNNKKDKQEQTGAKISDGQKMYDKEFAKDINEFTGGGFARLENEINKIDNVVARLRKGSGTTGGFTGIAGDRFTSDAVLKNRADVQQSAMTLIKTLLSGATSDKDREQIVNTLWNEADSTENNIERLKRFSEDMRSKLSDNREKAKYFENSGGTLFGYKSQGEIPINKNDMPQGPGLDIDLNKLSDKELEKLYIERGGK